MKTNRQDMTSSEYHLAPSLLWETCTKYMPTLSVISNSMNSRNNVAVGHQTPRNPRSLVNDNVTQPPRDKGTAAPVVVPNYDAAIVLDAEGNAMLPCNFMPAQVDKLPDVWFYSTYAWFKFFDQNQRDAKGNVSPSDSLKLALPGNVDRWKALVFRTFGDRFNEEGKYQHGLELGQRANKDGLEIGGRDGRKADTINLVMKKLFNTIAPDLLDKDQIGVLVSKVWKWFHVPLLESNNDWVKEGIAAFFKIQGAKVALSDEKKEWATRPLVCEIVQEDCHFKCHPHTQEPSKEALGIHPRGEQVPKRGRNHRAV